MDGDKPLSDGADQAHPLRPDDYPDEAYLDEDYDDLAGRPAESEPGEADPADVADQRRVVSLGEDAEDEPWP